MDYYQCPTEALRHELQRRAYTSNGSHDQLSERLQADDDERGSEATTVATEHVTAPLSREDNLNRTGQFGPTFPASELVNQKIVYWDLNTFFPSLQLFFESGFSCTIDGGRLPGATVGLDSKLRFRLTDCTYEEQGQLTNGVLPDSFARSSASITILEATVGRRTSTGVKPSTTTGQLLRSKVQSLSIVREVHTVIGLRLSGMSEMGYVWAKIEAPYRTAEDRIWGDVQLFGLRNDVPAAFLGLATDFPKVGGELKVVEKGSIIKLPSMTLEGPQDLNRPWI
ncbi:hypothetical protein OPT61_g6066 [Boeremia exigua]|uniref:Uncharacterized protein n=1 Tax=Boeremia exigua TaxID=749465 RepID=A0ACC2I800_9PLEO|nr:hypothetical protein OPT61_g6066 [Boeremia exigua]